MLGSRFSATSDYAGSESGASNGSATIVSPPIRTARPEIDGALVPTLLAYGEKDLAVELVQRLIPVQRDDDGDFAGRDELQSLHLQHRCPHSADSWQWVIWSLQANRSGSARGSTFWSTGWPIPRSSPPPLNALPPLVDRGQTSSLAPGYAEAAGRCLRLLCRPPRSLATRRLHPAPHRLAGCLARIGPPRPWPSRRYSNSNRFKSPMVLYRSRPETRPTRSASEVGRSSPRLRFGLVWDVPQLPRTGIAHFVRPGWPGWRFAGIGSAAGNRPTSLWPGSTPTRFSRLTSLPSMRNGPAKFLISTPTATSRHPILRPVTPTSFPTKSRPTTAESSRSRPRFNPATASSKSDAARGRFLTAAPQPTHSDIPLHGAWIRRRGPLPPPPAPSSKRSPGTLESIPLPDDSFDVAFVGRSHRTLRQSPNGPSKK